MGISKGTSLRELARKLVSFDIPTRDDIHQDQCNNSFIIYEGESISNQPNLFPVEIHLFVFDVIAL